MALASVKTVAAPTLEDARRVCDVLVEHGAGVVLVFGSVAQGTADEQSDIDMVAVFDDLGDYSGRHNLRARLINNAHHTTGMLVDLLVTDRPEWYRRTTNVTSSFEAAIADQATVLCDRPATRTINWNKDIGMPKDNHSEALERLADTDNALGQVLNGLSEGLRERRAADEQDTELREIARYERMANICSDSHQTIECAFKALACLAGVKAERTHSIQRLAELIPDQYSDVTSPATSPLNLIKPSGITLWHTAGPYTEARPALTLTEIEDTAIELTQMATKTAAALARHFTTINASTAARLAHLVSQVETELAASDIGKTPPAPSSRQIPNNNQTLQE